MKHTVLLVKYLDFSLVHCVELSLDNFDARYTEYYWPGLRIRVVNWSYFEARTRPGPEITSPNLTRARNLFLKPNFSPKAKFTEWVKISTTAEYQKT